MEFNLRLRWHQSRQIGNHAQNFVPKLLQKPAVRNPIAISLGALAGSLSNYYLTLWFVQHFGTDFPFGTFFINLTGCVGMGFFVTLVTEGVVTIPPEVQLLVAVGFLSTHTAFSTYSLDTITLLRNQSLVVAGLYWIGSALLGIVCLQLGIFLARLGSIKKPP
jgi:CrcB protein